MSEVPGDKYGTGLKRATSKDELSSANGTENQNDNPNEYEPGQGIGKLASSFFDEKGRRDHDERLGARRRLNIEDVSKELEEKNQLMFVENHESSSGKQAQLSELYD